MFVKNVSTGGALIAALLFAGSAFAAGPCGICDDRIVTNSALAQCFLDEYPFLIDRTASAIVVDLSACEQERSIVAPLASPDAQDIEPDVTFVVTKTQLDCLKGKLEQEGLKLDPFATIELDRCE